MTYLSGLRLPDWVEPGIVGGPRFSTAVMELDSGYEQRNANWQDSKGRWDASYAIAKKFNSDGLSQRDLDYILHFFYIVRGKAFSFRFKDWSDFEIGMEEGVDIDAQFLAYGDDTTASFQVFKRYQILAFFHDRPLTKLVSGTVRVYLDGALQTETTHYTVNYDTGIITFVTPPASTGGTGPLGEEVVTIRCEFEVHARFDIDDLVLNLELFNAGTVPNLPLMELLGTGV